MNKLSIETKLVIILFNLAQFVKFVLALNQGKSLMSCILHKQTSVNPTDLSQELTSRITFVQLTQTNFRDDGNFHTLLIKFFTEKLWANCRRNPILKSTEIQIDWFETRQCKVQCVYNSHIQKLTDKKNNKNM